GQAVDPRTDIWAFGCCFYEALTGSVAFLGETVSDTIAAILDREPDWEALPAATPAILRGLLRRCLRKDPTRRIHHVADARIEIEEALREPVEGTAPLQLQGRPRPSGRSRTLALGSVLSAILGGLAVWGLMHLSPRREPVARLAIPVSNASAALAISPDGNRLVYRAEGRLFLREMDAPEGRPIPGTERPTTPFFSPDSQWVGFRAQGKLKKVSVSGGAPITLCDVAQSRGATWGADDTIVFTPNAYSGLWQIPAAGGTPKKLTTPDRSQGEKSHRRPHFLPRGKAVLFTVGTSRMTSWDEARIEILDLATGERRVLIEGGTGPVYAASGHLVYRQGASLLAVPFDLTRLAVTGTPAPLVSDVRPSFVSGSLNFTLSESGTLVYTPGDERYYKLRLVLVDREGNAQPLTDLDQAYGEPRFSADGRYIAVDVGGANDQLARYDMARGTLTQLTFEWDNVSPVWTPDGKTLIFQSSPGWNLFEMPSDGSAAKERLTTSEHGQGPGSLSPDGRHLAFTQSARGDDDLWMLPLDGKSEPWPFLQTPASEWGPRFSPDGRWVAYTSDESGRQEIYVRSFPEARSKRQISTDGGFQPVWARSGKELFYRAPAVGSRNRMMAVEIVPGDLLRVSKPRLLFEDSYDTLGSASYDVAPDGQHFVMVEMDEEARRVTHFNVILNWFEELRRLVPTDH
ncbi:MAG: hypothetical protein ACE5JI_03830, partial [Acidobacteriota bacterium]